MGHPLLAIEPKPTKPFRITFTGADDQTSIQDMLALVKDYPMVEFGILFSPKRTGTARYPSLEWLEREVFPNAENLALAAHLCGGDSKEVLETGKSKHDYILSWYFGDTECYMSKGHQDFKSFMDSMREYGFDELGDWSAPSHQWWRTVPDRSGEYNVVYVLAEPHSRGAFPVTVMERR